MPGSLLQNQLIRTSIVTRSNRTAIRWGGHRGPGIDSGPASGACALRGFTARSRGTTGPLASGVLHSPRGKGG